MQLCSTPSQRASSGRINDMPRRAIIAASLAKRGALITVRDLDAACDIANRAAPEHLELAVANPDALLPKIRHAGAIFLGHHASEALGDYCAGRTMCFPRGERRDFLRRLVSTISRSARLCSVSRRQQHERSRRLLRRSPAARVWRRTRAAPSIV
jgi:histidinol dehydrogenase